VALFGSDFLKKLEYLSLISQRVFRGSLLAQRRTMQRGTGVEFADHRAYTPGDDFRHLDWNVFARHDQLLLKRFQEEEDLHVYFLLDASKSMALGTPAKFDYARQITAALAYIALADLDRISVTAYAGDIVADFPLTRGKARILPLLDFLERLQPQGTVTDLSRVATGFVHRTQRRGLAIIVSDLYDPSGYQRGIDLLRHRMYEPHLIQIHDPKEANPEFLGDLELEDVENLSTRKVTVSERSLRRYREVYQQFHSDLTKYCRTYGLACTKTPTTVPFDTLILNMMRRAGALG